MKNYTGIKVFAPATINGISDLGIDVFGVALTNIGDEIIIKHTDEQGIHLKEVHGGKGLVSKNVEDNPTCIAINAVLKHLGKENEGLFLEIYKRMPIADGLGSNESSAVAGALAINELLKRPLTKHELLAILLELDLNPTHLTASLFGGLSLLKHNSSTNHKRLSCPVGLSINVISLAKPLFEENNTLQEDGSIAKRLTELVLALYTSDFESIKSALSYSSLEQNVAQELDIAIPKEVLSCFYRDNNIVFFSLNNLVADEFAKVITTKLDTKGIKFKNYDSSLLLEGAYKL